MEEMTQTRSQVTLGATIKHNRIERGLDTEKLGAPELSEHYIEALERGAIVPSPLVLEIISKRLDMQPDELARLIQRTRTLPDQAALEEDLNFQLNYAKMLQSNRKIDESLALLRQVEKGIAPYRKRLSGLIRYRVPYLRGRAYIMLSRFPEAQEELQAALRLASEDVEEATSVRNLLGVVMSSQEKSDMALQHHLQCLRAVQSGAIKDLNLKLTIYRNLANDYLAVNDVTAAIACYKQALADLQDVNDPETEAGLYWGMAMAHQLQGDLAYGKLYAQRAMDIYEEKKMPVERAGIATNLAEMLITDKQFEEAEQILDRARSDIEGSGNKVLLGFLYKTYATLEHGRGQLDKAAEYAGESLTLTKEVCREAEESGRSEPDSNQAYAEALWTAALIAEDRKEPEMADSYFQQASDWIKRTGYRDIEMKIEYSYAQMLKKRGDFQKAIEFYEAALQSKTRSKL